MSWARRAVLLSFILLGVGLLPACSTVTIDTRASMRPVRDLKCGIFTALAVMPFGGQGGEQASATMQAALGEWSYYSLVERSALQKVINEMGLQHQGLFNQDTAARVGRLAGASHVLFGQVNSYSAMLNRQRMYRTVRVQVGTDYIPIRNKDGSVTRIPRPRYEDRREPYDHFTLNADVAVTFRVVTVETGAVAYSKALSRTYRKANEDRSRLPTREGILADLTRAVCNEFRNKICPHSIRVKRKFLKPDSDVKASEKAVARALKLIRSGDIEGGELALKDAIELDTRHVAAMYNLAVVYALQAKVADARKTIVAAVRLDPDRDVIVEGKQWIDSLPQ